MLHGGKITAQVLTDGYWSNVSGSWGNRGIWGFENSLRPATANVTLNSGATASAVRTGDKITAINVTFGGGGYKTPPNVIIGAPNNSLGVQATAEATLNLSGEVSGIAIVNPGSGYTGVPSVTVSREINQVNMTDVGYGYATPPSIFFNGGGGYTSLPTVAFRGGLGDGAVATATVSSNRVTAITVTNGGSGYSTQKPPTIAIITSTGGSGATAKAVINASGVITAINVTGQGSGYNNSRPPSVFIGSPSPDDLATGTAVVLDGQIISVEINSPGSGYTTAPSLMISGGGATGNGNVQGVVDLAGDSVAGVTITNMGGAIGPTDAVVTLGAGGSISSISTADTPVGRGWGLVSSPTVLIGAPLIRQATATATQSGGGVSAVTVGNPGSGYLSAPSVTFANTGWQGYTGAPRVKFTSNGVTGALATAARNATTGAITSVAVQDGGANYTVPPSISFVGGNGINAAATATIAGGSVLRATMTNVGSGYGIVPTITFVGGGGTGATGEAIVTNNQVTAVNILSGGTGYTSAPTIVITAQPVSSPATATANLLDGKVTSVTINDGGAGYTSTPTVVFSSNGISYAVAAASAPNGRLSAINLSYAGDGYITAPTVSLEGGINLVIGGVHGAAEASINAQGRVSAVSVTSPGGAIRAVATATLTPQGNVSSINVVTPGTGYTINPAVTLGAPTGIGTPVQPTPGGVGAYLHFNRDIGGNATITLDAARIVGSLSLGDFGDQDYLLSAGTGGLNSSLTFNMGLLGAGKSFLNKISGSEDEISARVVLEDQLNVRITTGRLTLSGGIEGDGTLVTSGNSVLTIRGPSTEAGIDLWLWNRGTGSTAAQVELGVSGSNTFGNIRLGNASFGTAGNAVLQLLLNRAALPDALDQIGDTATVLVDGATNRWGYFKLMGASETIGNIIDSSNALVLENMEGETINTNAVLTLGGNNLDSFIGGFVRNRASGSGTGTLGLTKIGTGSLTLQGGNINYTGATLLEGGVLNLINTTNFASAITASDNTKINVTTTGTVNFDNDVLGKSDLTKFGNGTLNLNSGRSLFDSVTSTAGQLLVRPGEATLRGGQNIFSGPLSIFGDSSSNRVLAVNAGLTVGGMDFTGRYGVASSTNPFNVSITGSRFNVNSVSNFAEGVLESSSDITISNASVSLSSEVLSIDRVVQTTTSTTALVLNDVSNLLVGSILTLKSNLTSDSDKRNIPPLTQVVAIDLTSRVVTLSKAVKLVAGTEVTLTYSSNTDGAIRGESVNFTQVVHDGRKFVATTSKGTIHVSLNGSTWDKVYTDSASVAYNSISWTGDRLIVVGDQGRLLTSVDGYNWSQVNIGGAINLQDVTGTQTSFTAALTSGSAVITSVASASTYLPGTPVYGFATPPDTRITSVNRASATITLDAPALTAASGIDFGYFTGNVTLGGTVVTQVKTAQNIVPGPIQASGIPSSTSVLSVDAANNRITLSAAATVTATGVDLNTATATLTRGNNIVRNVSNFSGFVKGMVLSGQGIVPGATIEAMDMTSNTITLSIPATITGSLVPVGVFKGRLTAGSAIVEDVSSLDSLSAKMVAGGVMIPVGTYVVSNSANTLTLSQQVKATAGAARLSSAKFQRNISGDFSALNDTVINVSSVAGLVTGMQVALPGVIAGQATITAINGNSVTLSSQALVGGSSLNFTAGFDLVVCGENGLVMTSASGEDTTWLTRTTPTTRDLNALAWSGSLLVAVGEEGRMITSADGTNWTRLSPPLTDTVNVIVGVDAANSTITLNNPALVSGTQTSFGAFKGNTTAGSTLVTNVSGMRALREGLPVSSAFGILAGTTIRSVDVNAASVTLSTSATATASNAPIRTFLGIAQAGSAVITDVTDLKGLMVGMSLHSSAYSGLANIVSIDEAKREISLSRVPTNLGRHSFGAFYGTITNGSNQVTSLTNMPSINRLLGAAHLTAGKALQPVDDYLGSGLFIQSYNATTNSLTLQGGTAIATGIEIPILSFTGAVTNGSSLITGVSDFSGLSVGMNLFVTGTELGPNRYSFFTIESLSPTAGTITLSGAPSLNTEATAVVVPLAIFLGRTIAGSAVVTNLSNNYLETAPSIRLADLRDVVWTGSSFVTVGDFGAVLSSSNGSTWTARNAGTGRDLLAVGMSGSQILAAGENGIILRSSDAISWTQVRAPEPPSLNDIRHIRDIKAVISAQGNNLALGNGGLATTDSATWSSSLNSTFSGTTLNIGFGGSLGGGGPPLTGIFQINNVYNTTSLTTASPGVLADGNNNNRIDDAAIFLSSGGEFRFLNNGADRVFAEKIGGLNLSQGNLRIMTARSGAGGSSTLTFGSLDRQLGATVDFMGIDFSTGSLSAVLGSLGENARNKVLFTTAPVLDDEIIGGWATVDNEWATYSTADGIKRLDVSKYDTGDQTGWIFSDNVRLTTTRTLTANTLRVINSLNTQGQAINLNGGRLSIESGGILSHTGTSNINGSGTLTVGTPMGVPTTLNVINNGNININVPIRDFLTTINAPVTAAGATTINLPNVVGLQEGMEVSGIGLLDGTRILSIDVGNNRIVLSVPVQSNIAANTPWSFAGGSVGLTKSGSGVLVLAPSSTYTGKTYLNQGTTRITATSALGAVPEALSADQLQINGGVLQIGHIVTAGTPTPLPNATIAFNDGLRGITIGRAGGRIEVGQANPNNDNGAASIPIVDLIITNPINAQGVLELAVRAAGLQRNSIVLGSQSPISTNTYAGGIKTEAANNGLVTILGNNTIGGIFQESADILVKGNNNFTAPILSRLGNITLDGINTWFGNPVFEQPTEIQGGVLKLLNSKALGEGGLNLILSSTGRLALAGQSQTIRQISGSANASISNDDAPDDFTGYTELVFDLQKSQTFAGSIDDGYTVSNTEIAPLKLIKRGPGVLTLSNSRSDFSAGIEIIEGALNVTSIASVYETSALGLVQSDDPSLLVIDKSVLSFTPTGKQDTDRSFTMGAGGNGAALVANGAAQKDRVIIGVENRDVFGLNSFLSTPIAFRDLGLRTLTLSGSGRGDNAFQLELGDSAPGAPSGLMKAGQGTWVLNKAAPYSGVTTVNDGTLVVTKNDALGTVAVSTTVDPLTDVLAGNVPNGVQVTFPLFYETTLPTGIRADVAYYVVNSNGTSFQVAPSPEGLPLDLTSAGQNVKFVAKIDSFRSTDYDHVANTFTGALPNGAQVTFNTRLVPGVTNPSPPSGLLTNTIYYVVNSQNGTFQISQSPGGTVFDFDEGTPGSLYYTTNASANNSGGVNLTAGTLMLKNVNYLTPETLKFEGGTLQVPADTSSIWSGDLYSNVPNSRLLIGQGGQLTLTGNLLGGASFNQEGEGSLIMRGEMITPTTNTSNPVREFAVRAGSLVLDYSLNNGSKLADNANLRLGGSRRGGTLILSGGNHREVVSQTVLEAGASRIYRESGTSSINLNNIVRSTGSSLYLDVGRIATTDVLNNNGILGAWAIIRDAVTDAFWIIPGSTPGSYTVTADPSNDVVSGTVAANGLAQGTLVRFSSTETLPGGILPDTDYYIKDIVTNVDATENIGFTISPSLTFSVPAVNITSAGSGVMTMTAETIFTVNVISDTFTVPGEHRLANGTLVRVTSRTQLPGGLSPDTDYYVVDQTSRTFRLSTAIDGQPVNITTTGSGVHAVQTWGSEKRAGSAGLVFSINSQIYPGADGNGRVKVAITHQAINGNISSQMNGSGSVADPYIYTLFTTLNKNSNNDLVSFVASDVNNPSTSTGKLILLRTTGTGTTPNAALDLASYGGPTFLSNGSSDNGRQDLGWARNEGAADGSIIPLNATSYRSDWGGGGLNHTSLTNNISVDNRNTYSVRFAAQNAYSVALNSGINSIMTGGILVSPSVGANDSTIGGVARLTTGGQGNLQNLLIHQYNDLGSLVIGSRITDRQPFNRLSRLPSSSRRVITGLEYTTVYDSGGVIDEIRSIRPGQAISGAGITAGTTVLSVDDNHTITLSQDHDGNFRRADYTFTGLALPGAGIRVRGTMSGTTNDDRRRIFGIIVTDLEGKTSVSTTDLYIGLRISGPGIPVGATITFIYNESDIQISSNHFFTGEVTNLRFTPITGIEKLGEGTLVLSGANDYTGTTLIANGTLRAQTLTDGGINGSLGASNAGSGNLFFNGGELQYVGENARTNRGFQLSEFASLNIGHELTQATFTGAVVGADRLEKNGPGTLVFNGNIGLEAIRVEQGRLLLQAVDTNFTPGGFAPSNFSTANLTSLRLAGGILELRGTSEGSITQNFGSQMIIEEGASQIKVTSVAPTDPNNLVALPPLRLTTLNLMGQEELTDIIRMPGGTLNFVENPESGAGEAKINLFLPAQDRQKIMPWATYYNIASQTGGVRDFALVSLSSSGVTAFENYDDNASQMNAGTGWAATRQLGLNLDISEGGISAITSLPKTFTGTIANSRFVNVLRYRSNLDSTVTINAGQTLEVISGAILSAVDVRGGMKSINGPGNLTGGLANEVNSDFIMHNYNPVKPFTIGANILDKVIRSTNITGAVGLGTLLAGEALMKIEIGTSFDFFTSIRPGMKIIGPGLPADTTVVSVDADYRRILLSAAALSSQTSQIYNFTEALNFIQTGVGTTILSGTNTYTGKTFVHGGVLRLDSPNAVPGGIATTGGTSQLVVEGGIIGLGSGDFTRTLGQDQHQVQFNGNGGFAAYGAKRFVNLGGASVPDVLRYGNNGFVPDGSSLILGSHDATHTLSLLNPIDLSAFSQAIRVEDGLADVEGELMGSLSGLGRMIKFGLGTLRLGAGNTHTGGIEIAAGRLIAGNVSNVFGTGSAGAVLLGTSRTNTDTRAAIELVMEGGNVAKNLVVGGVNAPGANWVSGGVVDNTQVINDVGQHASMMVVQGYPAIAYYDATQQDLKYVRALDARGVAWGTPVTVASRGNVGKNPSLTLINGNPAISYYDETNGGLMYVRANDAPGVFWGTPVSILAQAADVLAVQVQADGKVLVGGSFTQLDGKDRTRLARLNANGSLDSSFRPFILNGEVRSILVQSDGKIVVGGTFTTVRQNADATNNLTRNRLARFNDDGTLDTSFDPNLNGDVRVLLNLADGRFMVGGSFTTVAGVGRTRLARLNINGSLDASFGTTDIRNGEVRAIALERTGTYVIGGNFTSIRGNDNRNRLARITTSGGLDSFNPDANGDVNAVLVLGDDKLLVGGSFGAFAGSVQSRTRLARLNTNGSVDTTFALEVNGTVNRLILEASGSVLLLGLFDQVGNVNRNFMARLLSDGNIDESFIPNPDREVRSMALLPDGKIVMGGLFTNVVNTTQQLVGRINANGSADLGFARSAINIGQYSSLLFVNGAPAVAYRNVTNQSVEYIRSSDINGVNWNNPQVVDDNANDDFGVGISMIIANIGGDVLVKDSRNTLGIEDDEVTISPTVATIGTPLIIHGAVYSDSASEIPGLRIILADNSTGVANTAVDVTNWSTALKIPNTGAVGTHFSVALVDNFPAIAYQRTSDNNLMFIRATNVAGMTNNLRDPDTLEVLKRTIQPSTGWPGLTFRTAGSWSEPITLDASGNVGKFPSLAMVNGQPTTVKSRPAVTYYDETNGNLKYIASPNFTGDPIDSAQPNNSPWGVPVVLVEAGDVGRYSSLTMVDGLPAVAYYNTTAGDLEYLMINDASGYTRLSFTGNTNWQGNVSLQGTLFLAPEADQTAAISGTLSGPAGFKLISEGILQLTNAANNFGSSLAAPGVTTAPGAAINGAAVIRSGSLHVGHGNALGNATVEMGDLLPTSYNVERATNFGGLTALGGTFIALHNGRNRSDNGPGAFVAVSATIDGEYYGLVATQANFVTHRFTGDLPDGTEIRFTAQQFPAGIEADTAYYVMNPNSAGFQISRSPLGTENRTRVDLTDTGNLVYYIEKSKLDANILVKDQSANPEQNGIYQFVIDPDNQNLAVNVMNLVRVAAFDSTAEMKYGVRVNVMNGTSAGKSFFLARDVLDVNVSAIQWVEERNNLNLAVLASAADVVIANAIDVNAIEGTGDYNLGAVNALTSGQAGFSGPVTLQNLRSGVKDEKSLILNSSTNTGYGVTFSGVFSEADSGNIDVLSLIKKGAGTVTLAANNQLQGTITIDEGTLLIRNTPVAAGDSATGSGGVTVNAGAVLGGTGSIAGAVTLAGTPGNVATLRPGDPTQNLPGVEQLTINQPLTLGADSVLEFSIGAENMTKLAGTTIQIASSSAKIVVQAEPDYRPVAGTSIDLIDFNAGGFTLFPGARLLDLLQLPVATVWNTSQFLTSGRIISLGDAQPTAVTTDPVAQTVLQNGNATFTVGFTGTEPVTFQWMKNGEDIFGGTSQTLTITGATQASEGQYSVRVMNPVNPTGAVSNAAQLTVDWPVRIAVDLPANKKGSVNEPVKFKVTVEGEGPINYQWRKGDVNIGTNSPEFTIPSATLDAAGPYSVVVTGPSFFGRPANVATSRISTLTVSEGIPVVIEQPESESLQVGGNLVLSAQPGGGDPTQRTVQWLRNGVVIPGATSNTFTLCEVTTASAGDYTFRVTTFNPISGKFESVVSDPPASIYVADNTPKILAGQIGKTISLTVNVGATPKFKTPGYNWLRNGGPLPADGRFVGGNTRKLTIKALTDADTATYTCIVTGAPGTAPVTGGTHHLRVYNAAPVIVTTTPPPSGIIGGAYSWKIPVESDVTDSDPEHLTKWRQTPSSYAVTGLPSGLFVNKTTGMITGYPRVATNRVKHPNGFPIKITVSNAYRPSSVWNTFIDVLPMPVAVAGTYAGPVARGTVNGNLGGRFDMTITSTGAVSGKITLGSLAARSFKGFFASTKDGNGNATGLGNVKVRIPATRTLPAIMLEFGLSVSSAASPLAPDTLIVNASVDDCGNSRTATFSGWRNKWSSRPVAGLSESPTAFRGGAYNFGIALPSGSPLITNSEVPQGAGYAAFTVGTGGTTSIVGRTADDESFTSACPVGPTGQMFLFRALYTTKVKGSMLGDLRVETAADPINNDVSGHLTWVRPPNPANVTSKVSRLYRSGFGTDQTAKGVTPTTVTTPVSLVAFGGRYMAPPTTGVAPLNVILGLLPAVAPDTNAVLNFSETGEFPDVVTTPLVDSVFNPDVEVTIGVKSKASTSKSTFINPALTKVTVVPGAGTFSGGFTLQDTVFGLLVKRPATFRGMIIRKRDSALGVEPRVTTSYGLGYFINPLKPAAVGASASTTPKISGMVIFEGK